MAKKEVKLTFRTITPLWTGDAWQQNNEIRPSSLMGSLRFWFEVICYFSGICEEKHFKSALGRFEEEVNREKLKKCLIDNGTDFKTQVECLREQDIPLPSIIFGTTNWKSLIKIKRIKPINGYCFGNVLNLPARICISRNDKEIKENNDCPKRSDKNWSVFYFSHPYFYGRFEVLFNVEEKILEFIFYPLLTFMDEYGYWGGKWNLGYGRLRVEKIEVDNVSISNWKRNKFLFKKLYQFYEDKQFSDFLNNGYNFNDLLQKDKKIKLLFLKENQFNSYINAIKELLKRKAEERKNFRENSKERHKIFGKTGNLRNLPYVPQGSKILPYIIEIENGNIKAGFLSIAGLLNLEREGENNG